MQEKEIKEGEPRSKGQMGGGGMVVPRWDARGLISLSRRRRRFDKITDPCCPPACAAMRDGDGALLQPRRSPPPTRLGASVRSPCR